MAFLYRYMHLFEYNFVFMYKGVVLVDKTKLLLFYTIHFVRHYFTLSLCKLNLNITFYVFRYCRRICRSGSSS